MVKAWTRGADCIILDLEDAVAPADKPSARKMVKDVIPVVNKGGADVQVRINRGMEEADLDAIVVPGLTRPSFSAASIMATAMRSFTLPSGLQNSHLASTVARQPSAIRRKRTSGVFPTALVMSSQIPAMTAPFPVQHPSPLRHPSVVTPRYPDCIGCGARLQESTAVRGPSRGISCRR